MKKSVHCTAYYYRDSRYARRIALLVHAASTIVLFGMLIGICYLSSPLDGFVIRAAKSAPVFVVLWSLVLLYVHYAGKLRSRRRAVVLEFNRTSILLYSVEGDRKFNWSSMKECTTRYMPTGEFLFGFTAIDLIDEKLKRISIAFNLTDQKTSHIIARINEQVRADNEDQGFGPG